MKRYLFFAYLMVQFLLLGSVALANEQQDQAVEAALTFSSIIDNQNIQAAYWNGSELLRLANNEQNWIDRIDRSQQLLGTVLHRELKAVRSVDRYPGLPDDQYVLIYFEANATHKEKAAEVLLVHQENGIFRVCSYAIR